MAEEDDFVRITLRLPRELHESLVESAAKKRSMNAEIIDRLEYSFENVRADEVPKGLLERLAGAVRLIVDSNEARYNKFIESIENRSEKLEEETKRTQIEIARIKAELGIKEADPGAVIRRVNARQAKGGD